MAHDTRFPSSISLEQFLAGYGITAECIIISNGRNPFEYNGESARVVALVKVYRGETLVTEHVGRAVFQHCRLALGVNIAAVEFNNAHAPQGECWTILRLPKPAVPKYGLDDDH